MPGAALRMMRTAAGWRAARLALLVGAVFVLGVLCGGERAQAADGGPAAETPSGPGSSVAHAGSAADAASAPRAPVPGMPGGSYSPASVVDALTAPPPDTAGPLAGTVIRTVDKRVTRPVAELAGVVAGRLDGATRGELPGLPGPEQPLPLPGTPGAGDVRQRTPTEPVTQDLPPDTPAHAPSGAPHRDAPKDPDRRARTPGPLAGPFAHGPELPRAAAATDAHRLHRSARNAVATAGPAPAASAPHPPGAPDGRSDGAAPGARSAVDHGTPRPGGDVCAVAAHPRPPLRLAPGAAGRAGAPGTRDACRDVPVSPA